MISTAKTHLSRLLPKNAFDRGVSVLVGWTARAQLPAVLAAPLRTRRYSPEDFGLLAVYGSQFALNGAIASHGAWRVMAGAPMPCVPSSSFTAA